MYTFNKFAFHLLVMVMLFASTSCLTCDDEDNDENPKVTMYTDGYVYDAQTEKMIEGATVEIVFLENQNMAESMPAMVTHSDSKGFFKANISHEYEVAEYLYKVSHPNYESYEATYSSIKQGFCGTGYEGQCKDDDGKKSDKDKKEMTQWLKEIKIPMTSKKLSASK